MAEKSIKKPAAKKAPVKKTVSKPATAKKPVAKATPKKAPVKKAAPKKAAPVVEMPAPAVTPCPCGHECQCHHKRGFGRFIRKLFVIFVIFALGFAAAKMCCCNKRGMHAPRAEFANGCLVTESVKCPKMLEMLPTVDANNDGCIDRDEYRILNKRMHKGKGRKPQPAPEVAQ